MSDIYHLSSISELQQFFSGTVVIRHPLAALLDLSDALHPDVGSTKAVMEFYTVIFKESCNENMRYGRKVIDFQHGSIICIAPNQLVEVEHDFETQKKEVVGWALFFHPDLIRGTSLDKKIDDYNFFSYEISEALHLSEKEHDILGGHAKQLQIELEENIDTHTQTILVASIELMLSYCSRFYSRQLITRSSSNHAITAQVETYLKHYFNSDRISAGLPTVKQLAEEVNLSPGYLSDLLKKETGKSAQDHIHFYLIEKAKSILLGTKQTVNEIAYSLGFEYPQYFNKLFKQKTGSTPIQFRNIN